MGGWHGRRRHSSKEQGRNSRRRSAIRNWQKSGQGSCETDSPSCWTWGVQYYCDVWVALYLPSPMLTWLSTRLMSITASANKLVSSTSPLEVLFFANQAIRDVCKRERFDQHMLHYVGTRMSFQASFPWATPSISSNKEQNSIKSVQGPHDRVLNGHCDTSPTTGKALQHHHHWHTRRQLCSHVFFLFF